MKRITSGVGVADIIIGFYDVALGDVDSSYHDEETINPSSFSIPEGQWKEICTTIQSRGDRAIPKVNAGLAWMNSGPSTI